MAHPSNENSSIADDLLRNGYDRWARLEGEKQAISDDLKELFVELKGHGFTPKALRAAYRKVAKVDDTEVQEHDAVVDLYVGSLLGPRAKPSGTKVAPTQARDAREQRSKERLSEAMDDNKAFSAELVSAGLISKEAHAENVAISDGVAKKLGAGVISPTEEITETQPDPQAGSDLTTSHALNGQVAPNSDIGNPISNEAPMAVDGDSAEVATAPLSESVDILPGGDMAETLDGADQPPAASIPDAGKSAEASASAAPAPMYAEPGVVVWESAPPEGVARHPYSNLFGTAGQDIAVIEGDLEAANAAPIVKIGNVILDGWARYVQARSMFTEVLEDGVTKRIPLEYPVVQYDGTDPLIDCIKWNMDGRLMTSEQKFRVAQALTRMEPKRKADIYAAFELGMELVA